MFVKPQLALSIVCLLYSSFTIANVTTANVTTANVTTPTDITNKQATARISQSTLAKLQVEINQKDEKIKALQQQLVKLAAYKKLEKELITTQEKISNVDSQHSIIFNFITVSIALISLLGGGSALFSFLEAKASKKQLKAITNDFEQNSQNTLEDFKTQSEVSMQQALQDFNSKSRVLMQQFDHSEKIMRLSQMLNTGELDDDIFYADLTQLSQAPSLMMTALAKRIIEQHGEAFATDTIELAQHILDNT